MPGNDKNAGARWRVIVIGGHTRNIGKTQLVCDVIRAFPQTYWIAGKITQHGHGVCAQNAGNCGCAPNEHICAIDWETRADTGTDSARFLAAGVRQSFWLRTNQGSLAEGLPLLRAALQGALADRGAPELAIIVESNSFLQFLKPSLYFAVIDPSREDFKESAQLALDRAHALVFRGTLDTNGSPAPLWSKIPPRLLKEKPSVYQRQGESLPEPLWVLVRRALEAPASAIL